MNRESRTRVPRNCWCGASTASALPPLRTAERQAFPRVRCDGCGVELLEPQPDARRLAAAYAAGYYGASRQKFVAPVARAVAWFQGRRAGLAARWLRPGSRVLDVGCGNGGFLAQMAALGHVVEGTELDEQSAARARGAGVATVHVGDLQALSLAPGSYELVSMWHVFEHLRDPVGALVRVRELLKPGGTLVLSMPNAGSWQARWFGAHWFHHDPPRHLFAFGRRNLEALLGSVGFEVVASSTLSLEQNVYGFAQSALNAVGLPRDRAYDACKGLRQISGGVRALDLLLVGLLSVPAVILTLLEAAFGCGGTMTVICRQRT
jgi:2-polyprenyl-3-methyl-5-hydroxy-6-metoxy-1,4-benzoquinol methylase